MLAALLALPSVAAGAAPTPMWVDTMPVPDEAISHMSAFPSGEAFVLLDNRPDSMYRSHDFGMTWETLPGPNSTVAEMVTATHGYALGDGLLVTDDGAETWETYPAPKLPGGAWKPSDKDFEGWVAGLSSISAVGRPDHLAIGGSLQYIDERQDQGSSTCYDGKSRAAIFFAKDGGRSGNYRITKLPFDGTVERLGFISQSVGWALAWDYGRYEPCAGRTSVRTAVLITRDGGRTYEEVLSCPHEGEGSCSAVAMPSARTIVVGKVNGWVYLSKNGGKGFEPAQRLVPPGFDSLQTHWVSGVEFANKKIGYAVAKGGGTWRTDDAGETWSLEPSSQTTWGIAIGDIAVADTEHAIAGGPNSIITRLPSE